jgi:hypothetical protein
MDLPLLLDQAVETSMIKGLLFLVVKVSEMPKCINDSQICFVKVILTEGTMENISNLLSAISHNLKIHDHLRHYLGYIKGHSRG